jgi:glycosyltransferase involved in cell wall biosynthesis
MNARAPAVSIVLPVYNGARFLAQSIESVLAQTFRDWELIVVDDASTDQTPEIIAGYRACDPRIISLRNLSNRRLPGALNAGFSAARGAYLTWTSDDNCYRPEAIARMMEALEANPGAGLVYCDYICIDEDGQELWTEPARDPRLLPFGNIVGACFLYRREVREAIGEYDDAMFLAEDYDYWLRVARQFVLKHLPQTLYLWRWHAGSLTVRRPRAQACATEKVLRHNLRGSKEYRREIRALAYLHLACNAYLQRRPWAMWRALGWALAAWPAVCLRTARQSAVERFIVDPAPSLKENYRLLHLLGTASFALPLDLAQRRRRLRLGRPPAATYLRFLLFFERTIRGLFTSGGRSWPWRRRRCC